MRKLRNIFFAAILISVTNNIAHAADIDYAKEIVKSTDYSLMASEINTRSLQREYPCLGEDFKAKQLELFREGNKIISLDENMAQYFKDNETQENLKKIYEYLQSDESAAYKDDWKNTKFNSEGAVIFPSIEKNKNPYLTKLATLTSAWFKSDGLKAITLNNPAFNANGLEIRELPYKYVPKDKKTRMYKCKEQL